MGQTALKVVKLQSARKNVYYQKIFLGSECDGNNIYETYGSIDV